MTIARRRQLCLESTPYFHCVSRCVRRAFLCGEDALTGRSFSHRKQWVVDKLKTLSSIFAIDICAYAVMSNHYHLVLRVSVDRAQRWSDMQVVEHWCQLFHAPALVGRWMCGEVVTQAEHSVVQSIVAQWRGRLYDISWFMRCLNECIARRANAEDDCKGRFWEGRFKSQALLDEAAVLTCMSYVDLNPIRAGLAETPEASAFTSVFERIQALNIAADKVAPLGLAPFSDDLATADNPAIPFSLRDYLQLLDWSGRAIREDKRGVIPSHLGPVFDRLGLNPNAWITEVCLYGRRTRKVVGAYHRLRRYCDRIGQAWVWGGRAARVA